MLNHYRYILSSLSFSITLGFTWSDIKAVLAAITYIITSATKYDIDSTILNTELQQLGLPKENSDGISRPFRIHQDRLRAQATVDSLKLPRLLSLDWRVDTILATSTLGSLRNQVTNSSSSSLSSVSTIGNNTTASNHGEPILHLRLGLSHTLTDIPLRIPAPDCSTSKLLLQASTINASYSSGGASTPSTPTTSSSSSSSSSLQQQQYLEDLALLGLNITPITLDHSDSSHALSSPKPSSITPSPTGGGGTPSAATPHVHPTSFVNVTLSSTQAQALLAELKLARTILTTLQNNVTSSSSSKLTT